MFFILIFLTCNSLEKRKEKLELVYKGDGLVKNFLLQVSVFLVLSQYQGHLIAGKVNGVLYNIFSLPTLSSTFPRVTRGIWRQECIYVVTCSSSPLPRWWHKYGAVSFTNHPNLMDLSS